MDFTKSTITGIFDEIMNERDAIFPEYKTRDMSDFGVMLLWVLAVVLKFFSDWVHRLFKNMFISTAIDREYVIDNALERGYRPRGVLPSRQLLVFSTNQAVTIPKGTRVQTEAGVIYATEKAVSSPTGGGNVRVYATQGDYRIEKFDASGNPNQMYVVAGYPFVEGSVRVVVTTGGVEEEYTPVVSFVGCEPSEKAFMSYSDELGRAKILFGNGVFGYAPELGAVIEVHYSVGVGTKGNAENDTIKSLVNSIAGVTDVANIRASNAVLTSEFRVGDTSLIVDDTGSFMDSGVAYIGGVEFSYSSRSPKTFDGVTGLDSPFGIGSIVSCKIDGIVDGKDLETNDEIKAAAIGMARMNNRLVSGEDYASFAQAHPSLAWAKFYVANGIVHVLAMPVDGTEMTAQFKTKLVEDMRKIAIPTTRFFLEDPQRIPIDVVIEIESQVGSVYESSEIVSEDPVVYRGVYNNVVSAISSYLSPLNAHAGIGTAITLRVFDIYKMLSELPNKQVKNSRILSFSKSEVEPFMVKIDGDEISALTGAFKPLDVGDVIKIVGSVHNQNKFVKVVSVLSPDTVKVNHTFEHTEDVYFYYATLKDIQITGMQVPTLGNLLVINANKQIWYEGSAHNIAYPNFVIESSET